MKLILRVVFLFSVLAAAAVILLNRSYPRAHEIVFGSVLLTIAVRMLGTKWTELEGVRWSHQNLLKLLGVAGWVVIFGAAVLVVALPERSIRKELTIDLYFNVDKLGFLHNSTREKLHPTTFYSVRQLRTMTELLQLRRDLRESLRHRRSHDLLKEGEPLDDFGANEAKVHNLFRDYGEVLLLSAISVPASQLREFNIFEQEHQYVALPVGEIGQNTVLRLTDFYDGAEYNEFLGLKGRSQFGYGDVAIYLPRGFLNCGAIRQSFNKSIVSFSKKAFGWFDMFVVTLTVEGPAFISEGNGQLPFWLAVKDRNAYWMTIRYRFHLGAEARRPFSGAGEIKDYLGWSDSLWRSIETRFAWTQLSDEHKFIMEFLRRDSGGFGRQGQQ